MLCSIILKRLLSDILILVKWPTWAQLGKNLQWFPNFINRKYFEPILKMAILIHCIGKFCYRRRKFQNTEAAMGGVLKSFTKFTEKHLCQIFFFDKVAGLRRAALLKKRLRHRLFSVNFVIFLEHLFCKWLFLKIWKLTFDSGRLQLSGEK